MIPKKNNHFCSFLPGFSLVEVMTVLLVISLGLVGVLSLIAQNIKSQNINEKALVAHQLAQEGIEIVRSIRDGNWKAGIDWRDGLPEGSYYGDFDNIALTPASSIGEGKLLQDASGLYYSAPNTTATSSIFSRLISIDSLEAPEEGIIVNSVVYWSDHGQNFSYPLQAYLYDWK